MIAALRVRAAPGGLADRVPNRVKRGTFSAGWLCARRWRSRSSLQRASYEGNVTIVVCGRL